MTPEWCSTDASLSEDPDLRELQLRYFHDDLWMRRIAFAVSLLALILSAATAVFLDEPLALAGAPPSLLALVSSQLRGRAPRHQRGEADDAQAADG